MALTDPVKPVYEDLPLSIVIPAYNEEGNIEAVIQESIETLQKLTRQFDIVVVDDHSDDATQEILKRLAIEIPQLTVIRNETNLGCHPSSLVGFRAAKGEHRYFIPGDRQIPAGEMSKFLGESTKGNDVVYSWRVNRADPPHRAWVSGLYNILMRLFFGIRVHDVDSSSLLTRKAVETLLPIIRSDSAFITVEILLEAARRNIGIAEVKIEHRPRIAGVARGLNPKDLSKVPLNFLRTLIWFWQKKKESV